jgi:choice-of-anchor C domain-containing protein
MKMAMVAACAALLASAGPMAHAAGFTNGSFESVSVVGGEPVCAGGASVCIQYDAGAMGIAGWQIEAGSVDVVGTLWAAADGLRSVDLSGAGAGTLSQSFDTMVGTTYQVSFQIGGNFFGGNAIKTATASAGGVVLPLSFDNSASTGANMGWQTKSFSFTAQSATTTLRFVSESNSSAGMALDDVRVTVVPEPQTWALWAAGLALLLAVRRRRDA